MGDKNLSYAEVILPLPLPKLYTFKIQQKYTGKIVPGMRVIVQFGTRKYYTAIVKEVHTNEPKGYDTKEVLSCLEDEPIISRLQLILWEWIAQYYMCSIGEVYKAALPSGLKLESETSIILHSDNDVNIDLNEKEKLLLSVIKDNLRMRIADLPQITGSGSNLPIIKSLLEKKRISLEENLKETYKPKYEKYVNYSQSFTEEQFHTIFQELQTAPLQLKLFMTFIHLHSLQENKGAILQRELLKQSHTNHSILNSIVKKGVLVILEKATSRLLTNEEVSVQLPTLNRTQQAAYDQIMQFFKGKEVVLLHGVTSSGKTEMYIRLIKQQIEEGKEVLYLLPEIALTTQIINRLKRVFGNTVGVYHSKFSDAERVEIWNNVNNPDPDKKYKVIIGVRSSVFLPFNNLGLIIVDEEHENTYKQFDPAPRYHARDVAIYLASLHGAKTLLGTATPSVETYYNATIGKYGLVELNERYTKVEMPEIRIVDTREAYRKKKMKSHFSPQLLEHVEFTLKNGEQVILFQNRRGFSPFVQCDVCGWIPYCINCNVSLTYHKHINRLLCHYCGHNQSVPKTCAACGSLSIKTMGIGTEKVEDEIQIFFPEARVARLDMDTARSRKAYEKIIEDFEDQRIDILIGTQMITKGLDFNHVNLVGIINADNMLNFADFRAFERSYQLMVQVSGRAGRKHKRGTVIIQTSDPKHPILCDVLETNYKSMYRNQITDRRQFKYPPFYRLIYLNLKHKHRPVLNKAATELGSQLRTLFGNRILGPEFPAIDRLQKWYIKQIVIKIEKEKSMLKAKEIIGKAILDIKSKDSYKSLQVIIDVDPM